MNDEQMWIMGRYVLEALNVAFSHFSAGLAGKKSHTEYFKKPILHDIEEKDNGNPESREEIAAFEMKQRIKLLKQQGLPESPM